jgi:hypothetical protein
MLLRQIYFLPGVLRREWKKKEEIEKIMNTLMREAKRCVPEPVEVVEVNDIKRTGRGRLRAVISEVSR